MKILVTGSQGFIGKYVVKELNKTGWFEVFGFDIRGGYDINNARRVEEECEDVGGIVHLAAVSRASLCEDKPAIAIQANVLGTINVLDGMRQDDDPPWMILASTALATSTGKRVYEFSKRAAEEVCDIYREKYGLKVYVLRIPEVYGEGAYLNSIIPILTRKAASNQEIVLCNPEQKFDFIPVFEVAKVIKEMCMGLETGGIAYKDVNTLSGGGEITLRELAKKIVKECESKSVIREV